MSARIVATKPADSAVSVVVPTRDRPGLLVGCLEALRASARDGDEIVVVDSASSVGEVGALALAAGARYVRCDRPGASRARNAGWRAAKNAIVAFIDDDVRTSPDWAYAVAATFAAHPDIDFVTGRIGLMAGDERVARPVAIKQDVDPKTFDRDARSDRIGHGANLVVRRRALDAVGGFDERLGPGTPLHAAEDHDLFDRLLGAGFVGRYEPKVDAVHVQWRTKAQLLRLDWGYGVGSGARLAKLLRRDRGRLRVAARAFFWEWGLQSVLRHARARWAFMALTSSLRVAGGLFGVGRGLVTRWSATGDPACAPPPHAALPRRRRSSRPRP